MDLMTGAGHVDSRGSLVQSFQKTTFQSRNAEDLQPNQSKEQRWVSASRAAPGQQMMTQEWRTAQKKSVISGRGSYGEQNLM